MSGKNFCLLLGLTALLSYLIGGWNCAITFSKAFHGEDIRKKGSGNPGFTNYKRVYGGGFESWSVMVVDLLKGSLPVLAGSILFGRFFDCRQFGAAWCGFFCMTGHCFPAYYGFKGGKGFLTGAAAVWFVDWRMGLIAACVFLLMLYIFHYMSLASCVAALSCPVALFFLGPDIPVTLILCLLSSVLLVFRHKSNIIRLLNGTESKFSLLHS